MHESIVISPFLYGPTPNKRTGNNAVFNTQYLKLFSGDFSFLNNTTIVKKIAYANTRPRSINNNIILDYDYDYDDNEW